ncbi:Dyp-type peroxidase [Microbispora sp. RL4-1S]|uniref:Dyp-type peroxidase n=1 Tax=Microbispora oryzae TaxID=2806554 RepID=A0A941AMW1_9ACTN|nr:Dyp-type peroxidase [Microbispora oryzae]MBP2707698.1 Dyp-type peroxidase [Microbispora oryzae]
MSAAGTPRRFTRRGVLAATSAAGAAAVAGAVGGTAAASIRGGERAEDVGGLRVPFDGVHQAGILAPPAAHGWFAAFDLAPGAAPAELASLLRTWTRDARLLTAGEPVPGDDAMALGHGPSSLTITVGFGASLLRALKAPVPAELAPIPPFPRDELDPRRGDGDIGVLLTADDAIVVAHALRALTRTARGTATVRWQMSGFNSTGGVTVARGTTPRNLMGQLDGTGNPKPDDPGFGTRVFAADPAWMRGGTYLVFRRIRMLLDAWDTLPRERQEQIIGRRKDSGAPLSGGTEFTPLDLGGQNPGGGLAIGPGAHVRQAAPASNAGATILRKGFSYFDGLRPDGAPDAGLLFLAFQNDPRDGFTRIQQRLALADELSRFVVHETSALFAVPPGTSSRSHLGQSLLDAL